MRRSTHVWRQGCRTSLFAVSLALLVSACAPAERTVIPEVPPVATAERPIPWEVTAPPAFRRAVTAGTRTEDGRPGPNYWIQEAEYVLHARVHPDVPRLEGSAQITYHNNSPDELGELHLELVQNIHREDALRNEFVPVTGGVELARVAIDGLTLPGPGDGGSERARYEVTGTDLAIYLPNPVAPGESVSIDVEWSFVIPQKGAGARMGHQGGNLVFAGYWYPVMAVYDDVEGWNIEQFTGTAEFYADFADYELTVEAPEDWIVWATGELQNPQEVLQPEILERMRRAHESDEPMRVVGPEDFGNVTARTSGGFLTWRFTADKVRDVAFSLTRESIWEAARTPVGDRDGDGVTDYTQINTFYRESAPFWARVTEYQQHAISFLSEFTGFPYRWPHMTAVEGGGIIGGGMEYPMMTLIGDYNQYGPDALYYVTAHELAHMWIPMVVNTNERRFSWIDEGFTTFNENSARNDFLPGEDHFLSDQRTYAAIAAQEMEGEMMRPSAYHATSMAFGIASYAKPATVLAALREVLGEDVFNRAYRTFVADWAYRHPYPWDLFNTFERVSGRDLDWFWRTWYYETWTLDQAIADVRVDGNTTTIHIRDEGLAPMPVLLEIELEDGDVLRRDIPVDTWLRGRRNATLTLDTPSPVVRVSIDPDNVFPDVDLSDNDWMRGQDAPAAGQ